MLNYFFYRAGKTIALTIPLQLGYKIAEVCADIKYAFSLGERKAVGDNLKAIFPEKSGREISLIKKRMFRNFAKYLVDFFRFSKLDKEYINKNIRIENLHYLDQATSKGKGAIVLTAHLGNWELGGVVIALSGYPLWVVALPHKDAKVNEFFNNQRQSKGINVIPVGRAARQCLRLLRENKIIALVGDRDFSDKGVEVDFFGKPTPLPLGPATFALKTGGIIVPGFMFRNADDSFTLRIEPPIDCADYQENQAALDTQQQLLNIIKIYKDLMERYIKEFPEQWYVFRRFWVS